MRKEKGITLIALIITIIIMLILAGVVINLTIGENGLFKIAKKAGKDYEISSIKEQIITDVYDKQAQNEGDVSEDNLKEILEKYGTLSEEESLMDKILTTSKGNYEIKVSDIFNGTTTEDSPQKPEGPTFTTVANAPDISGFNKSNTYYVSWDLTSSPYTINDTTLIDGMAPSNWYDYTAGVNHWANVKTAGGGNDCYWVWIPRYAYRVPTKGSTAETIEVKFLKGTSNIPIGETEAITNTTPTPGLWVVHPAFTNIGNGGFGELTGMWVAKFEASSNSVDTINIKDGTLIGDIDSLNGEGGGLDTSLQVRVKPNVTSWRGLNVNGIFEVCQNLTKTVNGKENSLVGSSNIDSHMMKNTEWGAVAYLSSSKYGKTDGSGNRVRVYNNPYYDETSKATITGLSGETATQINKSTTTNLYKYNTQEGSEASVTGNVYGIYDMAGGAYEWIAGIYNDAKSDNNTSKLWSSDNKKYVDRYTKAIGSASTYYGNTDKYGDAIYETSSRGWDDTAWDACESHFIHSDNKVCLRGGVASRGGTAGIFAFNGGGGVNVIADSFRPVLSCLHR